MSGLAPALACPRLLTDKAYVDGRWIGAAVAMPVVDPATGATIARVPDLGGEDALRAVAAAHAAFPAWRDRSGKERSALLRRLFEAMVRHRDDLAVILTAEQGKPLRQAREEIDYAAAYVEWFAEEAKRVDGHLLAPHRMDRRLLVRRQPVGVVAAITPWNFPLAMITRKVAPALAVGCTVVLKPSDLTPLSALAFAVLADDAGIPPGVINVVTGQAEPIGEVLTDDARVRKLTFTGSTRIGKLLAARCSSTVKRLSLELGGNAPFIVFDDADLDEAVEGAVASKFRNSGQTCVSANRLLVQSGIYDRFTRALAERVGQLTVGPGGGDPVDIGPLIDGRAVDKCAVHVADAVSRGGRVLAGGEALARPGHFFAPTVIADVDPGALLCREETFGPIAGLFHFSDEQEAIAMANDTETGLAAYVYTKDADRMWRVAETLETGMVGVNTGLISTEVAPFGGVKQSGLGREGSRYGVDDYLDMKLMCMSVA